MVLQILDLAFSDISSRDEGVVRTIYEAFGLPLTERSKQAMREWSEPNPRNKHGGHSYSAEKFGTTDDAIWTVFLNMSIVSGYCLLRIKKVKERTHGSIRIAEDGFGEDRLE